MAATKTRTSTAWQRGVASQDVFDADLNRINAELLRLDAVVTYNDGFQAIDRFKAPADLIRAYRRLLQYGAANGLI